MNGLFAKECPACGGNLTELSIPSQFICAHCRKEYILIREDGKEALKPVVSSLERIERILREINLEQKLTRERRESNQISTKIKPRVSSQQNSWLPSEKSSQPKGSIINWLPYRHLVLGLALSVLIFVWGPRFIFTIAPVTTAYDTWMASIYSYCRIGGGGLFVFSFGLMILKQVF
jgi:uncharacterized Zn finger protein (UPF0148 family)